MDDLEFARQTLAGHVNDWVEHAKRNAAAVVSLTADRTAETSRIRAEAAAAYAAAQAAETGRAAAVAAARDAQLKASAAEALVVHAEEKLRNLRVLAQQLLERVVAVPDSRHSLVEHSGAAVHALAEELQDA